jgi:cytochrome P450
MSGEGTPRVHSDGTELPVFPGLRAPGCPFGPPAESTEWRDSEGLSRAVWHGFPVWMVSRYDDIMATLADHRLSADTSKSLQPSVLSENDNAPEIFPRMDDPEHTRLRRQLTKDFTVKRVNAMRPEIEKLADGFIDKMLEKGPPADLVRDYAVPIPSLVISLLLGVPWSEHEFFEKHAATMFTVDATPEQSGEAVLALIGLINELIDRKEHEPGDDLLSRVFHEHVATGQLKRETLAITAFIVLGAGHDTTANMIAEGTLALLQNPETLARLRDTDDPQLIAAAVEELLRYLSIVHSNVVRVATEDLTIAGQLVRAGEGVCINIPSGNWDDKFWSAPEDLDIDRKPFTHLAFGYGVHQCLGQQLARVELQIALPLLLRRIPDLALAVPFEELRWRHDMDTYGVHELPVTWGT